MIQFDVPFIPDDEYAQFLNDNHRGLESCHFSLYAPDVPDARHKLTLMDSRVVSDYLVHLQIPGKYLLMNSRFQSPGAYGDWEVVRQVLDRLEILLDAGVLTGLVYADAYWLQALSDAGPAVASQIEAVPSINCMIDTAEKLSAHLDVIAASGFKVPARIILDRSLNRNPAALAHVATACRDLLPEVKIGLLANEGCLYQCPFKLTHDAHIAMVNMGANLDTFRINRDLGCIRTLNRQPHQLFKSPFIRPEDVVRYEADVDVIKLCGRTLGSRFLMRAVSAYINREYDGNLLELVDAMNWLAQRLYVSNTDFPESFFDTVTTCDRGCDRCSYCRNLLADVSRSLDFSL